MKFGRCHIPGFFSEFFDERVAFDFGRGDSLDETEFALIVEIQSAVFEFQDDSGLLIGEFGEKIVARVTGGIAGLAVKDELTGHSEVNHERGAVV